MISRLTGKLIEKNPPQVVIDVNGVGYEADVSMQTFYNLPSVGETVHLYTQLVVREDAHLLFGFASAEERATFRQLVKVSGIGAKTALGILSAMNADELAQAVAEEDVKRLSSAPGIGKKPPNAWCWNCAANSYPIPFQTACLPLMPLPTKAKTLSTPCLPSATTNVKPKLPPKAFPKVRKSAKACAWP